MMWTGLLVLILLVTAYLRFPLIVWSIITAAALILFNYFVDIDSSQAYLLWSIFAAVIVTLNINQSDVLYSVNLFTK